MKSYCRFLRALVFICLSTNSGLGFADSDGYFCTGPSYLAYQFAFTNNVENHTLFIVDLSEDLKDPKEVKLDAFQVHGMECRPKEVMVLGWDAIYRVDVPSMKVNSKFALKEKGKGPVGFVNKSRNLGLWADKNSQKTIVPIESKDTLHKYELVVEVESSSNTKWVMSSTLRQLTLSGKPVKSKLIFRGEKEETVD